MEELWVPATELPDYGRLFDVVASLGKRLIRDFRSVFVHDAEHVSVDASGRG